MNNVPEWSEIRGQLDTLPDEEKLQALDLWEQDYATQLASNKDFSREDWELFRIGTAAERAGMRGEDPQRAVDSTIRSIGDSYRNLPYFNENPQALYNDEEFEKRIPEILNPLERAEARATRTLARQQRESEWESLLGSELSDLLTQANKDAKGPKLAGGRVGRGVWDEIGLAKHGDRELFQILKPNNEEAAQSNLSTVNGAWARDVGDIVNRIRAEGGDPNKIVDRLKQQSVWGNIKDSGNLVRRTDDGRIVFNPEASAELFDKERVDGEVAKLKVDDAEKETIKERLAQQRSWVANQVISNLEFGNATMMDAPVTVLAEAVGLKSDFNAFKAANQKSGKYQTDEALVAGYFEKLKSRPKLLRNIDALLTGINEGRKQFVLGSSQMGTNLGLIGATALGADETASDFAKLSGYLDASQQESQGSMTPVGGQTTAAVTRTTLDLATMIASGGLSAAATRGGGGLANTAAKSVARRMAANASEKVTLGPVFETAVARNVDDLAVKVGRIVGEGTAAVQSASGMFGDSYSKNLANNIKEVEKLTFATPEAKDAALSAAREDAVWSATKDGVAGGLITTALMRLVPGGVESVLGKRIAETPGKVTLRSLMKDVSAADLRTAFRSVDFRRGVRNAGRELGLEAGKEAIEEAADEAAQGLWASRSYDPDMTVSDFVEQVGTAAVLGGMFGTAVNAGQSALTPGESALNGPNPPAPRQRPAIPTNPEVAEEVVAPETLPDDATVAPLTEEEQEARDVEIQSDVDEIVATEPAVEPTPQEEVAAILEETADNVENNLPLTAEVLREAALQPEPTTETVEEATTESDEEFDDSPVTPNPGDTLVYGTFDDETGLPDYRNVEFLRVNDAGQVVVNDSGTEVSVDARDLLLNDRPVEIPESKPRPPRAEVVEEPEQEVETDGQNVQGSPGEEVAETQTGELQLPEVQSGSVGETDAVFAGEPSTGTPPASTDSNEEGSSVTVPPYLEAPVAEARRTGIVPTPAQLTASGVTNPTRRKTALVSLAQEVQASYPVSVPEGAVMSKGNSYWGSVKRTVSYPGNTFTNDPEITATQLMNKLEVVVPEDMRGTLNPAITIDEAGVVQSVNHVSPYVGSVTRTDDVASVRDRYKSDPAVKSKAREQLDSANSPERREAREETVVAATASVAADPDKVAYLADVQARRDSFLRRLEGADNLSGVVAEEIFNRAFDEYAIRLDRMEDPSKVSFFNILKSSVLNYAKQNASNNNAYDVDTRPTSLDALTEQGERGLEEDVSDDAEPETDLGVEAEETLTSDIELTRDERDAFFDLFRIASERDGEPGIVSADMSPQTVAETMVDFIDALEEDPAMTLIAEEEGLGNYLNELRASDPEGYTATIANFRSFAEKVMSQDNVHSRSVANAASESPLMSNIQEMNRLGIVPGDPRTVKAALEKLSKDKTIPKFYRDSAATLLKQLGDKIPNLQVTSTRARSAGEYNPGTHTILMNMSYDNGQGFIGTFLHEVTHAAVFQGIRNPNTPALESFVAELRALKDSLNARMPNLDLEVRGYKEQMLKELKLNVQPNDPLMDYIMMEAEKDLFYALGHDIEANPYSMSGYTFVNRGLRSDNNDDLQELAAHYMTDPMFRALADMVKVPQGNLGSEVQGLLGSIVAGAKTAISSARGQAIALAAGWNLRSPRALPNSNNLYGRPVETTRSYVQQWNVPNAPTPEAVLEDVVNLDNPPDAFAAANHDLDYIDPDILHSRASFGVAYNNPLKKANVAELGGFVPSGLRGFGAKPKDLAAAQQLKRNTEGAAQTAVNFFRQGLNKFLSKNSKTDAERKALSGKVNQALGSTDVRITDAQWKASQKIYDDEKVTAKSQYEQDMKHVQRLNRAGRTAEASDAYRDAVGLVRKTLNDAYTKMVNQRAAYRIANVAAAKAAQSTALNEIRNLDQGFFDRLLDFRQRLDALSSEVGASTGISPELRAAISDNQGIYLHRAYRVFESDKYLEKLMRSYREIGNPSSPGTIDPLKGKIQAALIEIRSELITETSRRLRKESRDQMLATYAQNNNVSVEQARAALTKSPTPLSRADADSQATDWIDNTDEGRAATDRRFRSYAEAWKTTNPDQSRVAMQTKESAVKSDIVKRRKDLPKWLRELWGEYEDPFVNAANTMMELTAYTAQQKYLKEVVAMGTNNRNGAVPFLTTALPGTNGDALVQIPGVDTAGWVRVTDDAKSPLAGFYAHPFTKAVLDGMYDHQASSSKVIRAFHKATGWAMMSKTVWSIQSHARNFVGNLFFIAANGNVFAGGPANAWTSAKDSKALLFGTDDLERQKFVEKLQKLGVLKDNQVVEILNQVAGAVDKMDFSKMDGEGGIVPAVLDVLSKGNEFVKDAYQAGDDFWKAFTFRAERAKIDDWGTNMTDEQKDIEAARRVRATMPTYSMAPEIVKMIRRTGVVGAFITFAAEAVRVSHNIVKLGVEDMRAAPVGSARWRQGTLRLSSVFFWQGVMGASFGPIMTFLVQSLAHSMFGDEEEDKIQFSDNRFIAAFQKAVLAARNPLSDDESRALREFLPEWQKDAQLWMIGKDKDGNISYSDVSYLNPLSHYPEVVLAAFRGWNQPDDTVMERIGNGAKNAMVQWVKPFLSDQLFAAAIGDIYYDKVVKPTAPLWADGDGTRLAGMMLFGRRDPNAGKIAANINHLWMNAFMPGTIRSAQRVYAGSEGQTDQGGRAYNTLFEALSVAGFAKIESRSSEQMVSEALRGELTALADASGNLTRTANSKGTVSDGTIEASVTTSEDTQFNVYRRMRKIYRRGMALGLTQNQIFDAAVENVGQNVLKTVMSGVYIPEPPSRATLNGFNTKVPKSETQDRAKVVLDAYSKLPVRNLDE